jgi:hypothetical protein
MSSPADDNLLEIVLILQGGGSLGHLAVEYSRHL